MTDGSLAVSDGEGFPETADSLVGIATGESLQANGAGVPHVLQGRGHHRVGDLAGAGLAAAGDVGHLDLADPWQRPSAKLDEVSLPDLSVVEVEHQTEVRAVYGLHQPEAVVGAGERHPWVVDGGVEVLKHEGDVMLLAQPCDPFEGLGGRDPHWAGDDVYRHHGQPVRVEPGAVQVEPGDAE